MTRSNNSADAKSTVAKSGGRKSGGLDPATKKLLLHYVAPFGLLGVSAIALLVIATQSSNEHQPADKQLHSGIRHLVGKYPKLKPMYSEAMSDKVLTIGEA